MISDSNLPIYLLALGLSLQGFSISLGMSITGNFLFEIVGNDPPAYFTIIYLLLELLGSIIGPFWITQAYEIKCPLCFTLISFCIGISIVMMVFSIRELRISEKIEVEKAESNIPHIDIRRNSKRSSERRSERLSGIENSSFRSYLNEKPETEMISLKKTI